MSYDTYEEVDVQYSETWAYDSKILDYFEDYLLNIQVFWDHSLKFHCIAPQLIKIYAKKISIKQEYGVILVHRFLKQQNH